MSFSKTEDWSWLEIYWIAQIKAWGFSLVNIKAGGEDNHCSEPSYEVVRKRAEKCIGISRDNKTKIAISKRLTGVKRSEETKEKVRQSIIKKQGRPVLQLDRSGNLIKEWPAGAVAARELGIDKANLNACCKGKRSHVEDIFGNTPWKSLVRLE